MSLGVSVASASLSIVVVSAVVAFSGSQMQGFSTVRDRINSPVPAVRDVGRDVTGFGMLFFAALWFVAPASASYMSIKSSTAVIDFNNRREKFLFRLFTLTLVLVALWLLVPWIVTFSNVQRRIIPSRVVAFRTIYTVANIIVALVLIRKSARENPSTRSTEH